MKRIIKNLVCYTTLLFCLIACNYKLTNDSIYNDVETITIDYDKLPILNTDSIVSDIRIIRLESTENNLISRIDRLLFTNGKIIVVDLFSSKSIHIFDESGKHINHVSHLGNGPQEYLTITDVDITPDGLIAIKDNFKDVILYYNSDGIFVKKEEIIEGGLDIAFIDDYTIAHELIKGFNSDTFKGASLCISSNNKIASLFGKSHNESDAFNHKKTNTLFSYNNIVFYTPSWENYIYEITDNNIKAKYYIDLKDDVLDYTFSTNEEFYQLVEQHNLFNGSFIEMENYTWLNFKIPNANNPPVIYSHKNKTAYKLSPNLSNPLLTYLHMPKALYSENTIAETASALSLYINKSTIYTFLGDCAFTDSLYNGLTLDDNPVVFLFTFKDDIGKYVIEE